MSDVTFEDVVELARQLSPVDKARLVERLAADMQQTLTSAPQSVDVEARLERFKANAKSIGEEAERLGYTEDDAVAIIEEVRQELNASMAL